MRYFSLCGMFVQWGSLIARQVELLWRSYVIVNREELQYVSVSAVEAYLVINYFPLKKQKRLSPYQKIVLNNIILPIIEMH